MRLDFCGLRWKGWVDGWMDVTQRKAVGDVTFFVLELGAYKMSFILRGRFWARFGMVGIVGLG